MDKSQTIKNFLSKVRNSTVERGQLSPAFLDEALMKEKLGYELYHSAKLATRGSRLGQRHSDNRGKEEQGNVGIYVVIEQIGSYLESELGKASRGSLLMKLDSINDWE